MTPVDELGGDYEQLLEMFEPTAQQSHLVWHYDHAGAYVPVDFPAPLANEELLAGGGPLGSAQGLLRELAFVAPAIGIDPGNPPAARRRPAGRRRWRSRRGPFRTTRAPSRGSGTCGWGCTRRRRGASDRDR